MPELIAHQFVGFIGGIMSQTSIPSSAAANLAVDVDVGDEWVTFEPGLCIYADRRRSWVFEGSSARVFDGSSLLRIASCPGEVVVLLDGALRAGLRKSTLAQLRPSSDPILTTYTYLWYLVNAYQTTHQTPIALKIAEKAFASQGRSDLEGYARKHRLEETGDDELAIADINALGFPARQLVERLDVPSRRLAELQLSYARGSTPIKVFGYSYCLERLSSFRTERHMQDIHQHIPQGVRADRCYRLHSSIGSDADHVDGLAKFISGLGAGDRELVVNGVFETASLLTPSVSHISDADAKAWLGLHE